MSNELLVIGISGVTCGGKTTIATQLNKLLPNSKIISQDDYFLDENDPRHTWIPELDHVNYDILSSLDMEKMHRDIVDFTKNKTLIRAKRSEKTLRGQNLQTLAPETVKKHPNLHILIVEGFTIFNYKPLQDFFSLKYFFTLNREECYKRRMLRVYEPPDCPGYFEKCVWPEYVTHLNQVKQEIADVVYFDEQSKSPLDQILLDVINHIE